MASPAKYVLLDLDGLILDTESLCVEVARQVVARHGKTLTLEAQRAALGKRPLECWADVAQVLELPATAQELLDESEPLLAAKWSDAGLLPGAMRFIRYLSAHEIPFAVATSTPRATFDKKMAKKPQLRELLKVVVCGDEVTHGKPHPEVFLKAAELLGAASPAQCLVLEDAPSGVQGATAAGMRVLVVPSIVAKDEYPAADPSASSGVVEILPSLLALQPQVYGLPPFHDLLHEIIPMDSAIHIKGEVVRGFGRGSKELGIPTANVAPEALHAVLSEAVTGIYCGWASIADSKEVYKMVMSIGWNPHFNNKEKTAEPWILADFNEPFYGKQLRLVVCGYVRPEASFTSLEALIARIHKDAELSKLALDCPALLRHKEDTFLLPDGAA